MTKYSKNTKIRQTNFVFFDFFVTVQHIHTLVQIAENVKQNGGFLFD